MWELPGRDDHSHAFAGRGHARHDVAQNAAVGRLIIGGDAIGRRPFRHAPRHGYDALVLDRTVCERNKRVAAWTEEAECDAVLSCRKREAALVAIAPGCVHAERRLYGDFSKAAETGQRVRHEPLLQTKLRRVVQMLQRASAAGRIRGA